MATAAAPTSAQTRRLLAPSAARSPCEASIFGGLHGAVDVALATLNCHCWPSFVAPLPLPSRLRISSIQSKHHSLMACCASSRPLLDGFFFRSAASFASRSLRKRCVFGLALLAPVPAHLSTNALSAPWAFSPSSLL